MKKSHALRRRQLLATIMSLLVSSTAAFAETPSNLIENGDFADKLQKWNWSAGKAKASGELDKTEKHSGEYAFRMANSSEYEPHVFAGLSQKVGNLQPNTKYRLSLWVKGKKVSHCWIGGGANWTQRKVLPGGDFDWKQISMEMTTGEKETSLEVRINSDGPTGALWIDDVELTPAGTPNTARIYPAMIRERFSANTRIYAALPETSAVKPFAASFRHDKDEKLGADVRMTWSPVGLRMQLNILDPTPSEVFPQESMWRGDSVQIAFDMNPDLSKPGGYNQDCVEVAFGLANSGKVEGYCFFSAEDEAFKISAVKSSGTRTATGYTLDLMIPWSNFGLKSPPPEFGFNLLVNDSQADGVRRYVEWTPGIGQKKLPDEYVRVHPLSGDQPFAAFVTTDQNKYDNSDIIMGRYVDVSLQTQGESTLEILHQKKGEHPVSMEGFKVKLPGVPSGGIREVQFVVPARDLSDEGSYAICAQVKTPDGKTSLAASRSIEREDITTQIARALPQLKSRREKIQSEFIANPALASDSYLQLGAALSDRFIKRIATGGPNGKQAPAWTILQARETAVVLDRTEARLALLKRGTAPAQVAQPATGKVIHRDGQLWIDSKQTYLYGYGHFGQIISDIPNFPALGVSLVQQETGPSRLQPDGKLSAQGKDIVTRLAAAEAGQIRMDLLLSPHYFPNWAYQKAPDTRLKQNPSFIQYDIDHPLAREVIETFLRQTLPLVKDSPALFSLCISNEPVYAQSGRTAYSAALWPKYLQDRYGNVETANAAYGTSYNSIDEIPVPPNKRPADLAGSRQYYDWILFNQQHFAQWHQWINNIVKSEVPNIPTHTKVMNTIFEAGALHYGTDPELLCSVTDLAGNDASAWPSDGEARYCYDWQREQIWYDLLHSFRGQTVFNSENHFIRDGTPAYSMPPEFTRAVFWQGALHHQSASTLWVWQEPGGHSDLDGSIFMRPANIYTTAQTFFDLRRHADKVGMISQQKAKVAILYSVPSVYWSSDYSRLLRRTYTGLQFLGQPVTFISEKQFAAGKRSPANDQVQVLIVPRATHVTPEALKGIQAFASAGGKVICIGEECLAYDDHSHPQKSAVPGSKVIPIPSDDTAAATTLRAPLVQCGVQVDDLFIAGGKSPASGVEYRVVPSPDGSTLISLINYTRETISVTLPVAGSAKDLLEDGVAVDPAHVELPPMTPRLLSITR